ncbi:MAG: hypothetical protein ACC726_01240 [Chloroflexota bacterium]
MPADPRRLIVSTLALAVALAVPALVAAQEDRVTETSTSIFTLLPDEGRVRADIAITLINRGKPRIRRWGPIWSPASAQNVEVTGPGLATEIVADGTGSLDTAVFKPLRRKQRQKIRVRYDLVDAGPDSTDLTRIGETYARFCWGGETTDTGTVEAILPAGWDSTTAMGDITTDVTTERTTLRASSNELPGTFNACTDAFTTDLSSRVYVLGPSGQLVTLDSWPEDPDWEPAVLKVVGRQLSDLETLIGSAMPLDALTIQEVSRSGDPFGSGTDFLSSRGLLLLDAGVTTPGVATTALARTWFNDETIADPRLREGLARWAGLSTAGLTCVDPDSLPDPAAAAAAAAAAEADLGPTEWYVRTGKPFEWDLDRLEHQAAIACTMVEETAEALGPEAMRAALGMLLASPGPADQATWLEAIEQ